MAGKFQLGFRSHVAANCGPSGLADNQKRSPREQKEFFMLSQKSKVSQSLSSHGLSLAARATVAVAALAAAGTAMANTYTYTPVSNTAPGDNWSAGTDWSATPVSAATTTLTFVGNNSTVLASGLTNYNTDDFSGAFNAQLLYLQGTGPTSGAATINIAAASGSYLNLESNGAGGSGGVGSIYLNANAGAGGGLTYNVSAPITLVGDSSYGNEVRIYGSGTATFNFTGGITTNATTNVDMQNAATINLSGGTSDINGLSAGSHGTVNINNGANLNVNGLNNGYGGSFILSGGTITEGTSAAPTGTDGTTIDGNYTINSGTVDVYVVTNNAFSLGYRGSTMATLDINGGTFTVESGTGLTSELAVSTNFNGTSNATVTQNGGTVTAASVFINNNSSSTLTDQGNGVYELNGGTLVTGLIYGQSGSGLYGSSTLDFNGGTLQASATNTGFIQGLTTVNVQGGGAVINTNGFNDTITSNLLSDPAGGHTVDGGLIKQGLGTLILSGTANTYNGNTTVSGGTLQINTGFLAVTSTVSIASGALMNLDYTGTDTITALYLNGISQAAGVYSYANDPTYFGNFVGTLTVTGSSIPEPATLGLMALGGLGILFLGKRRRRA